MTTIFFGLLSAILIGLPVAVAMGIVTTVALSTTTVPYAVIPMQMFAGMENFVFIAMPLFMIAGELMNRSGIAEDLIELASSVVGSIRGGLAMVNVGASMLFAEISGSAVADVAAQGTILIPQMERRGYPRAFAAAITSSSASIAIIIPPSLAFIIYGALAEVSVAKLFVAGVVPGLLLSAMLAGTCYIFAVRYNWPTEGVFQFARVGRALRKAFWGLTLPIIILGGILSGIFTPTEAAAMAVLAALLIGMFVTRKITLAELPELFLTASVRTSLVMLMVATSFAFGWYLTNAGIPQQIAADVVGLSDNRYVVMFIINMLLIALGVIMHGSAAMVLTVPLTLPLVTQLGYDPIHFGVILALNGAIGQQTPPVASVLLTACSVSGCRVGEVMKYNWWFILAMFITLQVVTYIPAISLTLPRLLIN
ncbi:TRAP transporter large permease [Ancylobacter sp. A5.8]|uniref:TRAP transporter large permease n=1 Tax=Ancylobacter gelatini TaxID=2919920 RepID=UPI001F4EB95F|nr:TRAP transporter large permease [Ancylobacter gelatini]MCJ8144632.1 TRAP transporter large permease [Ancylobacter gelatini]